MLQMIKLLDAGTVRGLIVATIPLLVLIASFFGLDEAIVGAKLEGIGEKLVALVTLGGIAWAAYARVFKPTPPLTETAVKATEAYVSKQGGFARLGMLLTLLCVAFMIAGCTGTRAAYKEASSIDEHAYVVAEHYSALVREAADLREKPTTSAAAIAAMQEADVAAYPVVKRVRELRNAYVKVRDAKTEVELQEAVNDAILLVADLVRAVKKARGDAT